MSTWDPGLFWEKYYSLWNKLVDLKWVDACLDWRDDGAFSGNRALGMTLKVGHYHPFEFLKMVPNPGQGANQHHVDYGDLMQSFATEASGWGASLFSGADDSVAFVTRPDTTALRGPVADLKTLAAALESQGNDGDIGELGVYLADWEGDSYDSFMVFHQRLTEAARYQAQYVNHTADYLDQAGGVICAGQFALIDGITALEAAVERQLEKRAADNRSESVLVDFLSIVSTGAGALGLIPGPQQAAAGAVSFVFGTLASNIPEEAAEPVNVEVVSAEDLAAVFTTLISDVATGCNGFLEEIRHNGTTPTEDLIDKYWDDMIPPRPDITEKIDPREFHHDTSPYYEG